MHSDFVYRVWVADLLNRDGGSGGDHAGDGEDGGETKGGEHENHI
jgi:hypothetical protein